MWSSIQVLPNQVSKNRSIRLKILTYESPMQRYIKHRETLGADSILRLQISIYCLPRNFNWFPLYFAQCSFTEMKTTFIKLQNGSIPKDIRQELLIVNNSVLTCPIFFIALSQWRDLRNSETVARDLKLERKLHLVTPAVGLGCTFCNDCKLQPKITFCNDCKLQPKIACSADPWQQTDKTLYHQLYQFFTSHG